jgi:hypothetical protein
LWNGWLKLGSFFICTFGRLHSELIACCCLPTGGGAPVGNAVGFVFSFVLPQGTELTELLGRIGF